MKSYKHLYSNSLSALGDKLHFSAHSHHLWPDCVQKAQNQYVLDAFQEADQKWSGALTQLESELKAHIAKILNTNSPEQICFAPNVHTLLFRLMSCFDTRKSLRILSTNSEFYSFKRQADRLAELDNISLTEVPVLPFDQFKNHFLKTVKEDNYEIIYLSHVFFDSGLKINFLEELILEIPRSTMVIIDGYHACGATPVDLSKIHNRIFYLAGGYKYLQSGEGVCFMTTPNNSNQYRPLYTGWFAEFDQLSGQKVAYPPNANRFLGATTDPSGMYRMRSVFEMYQQNKLDISNIHNHVLSLQEKFLQHLRVSNILGLGIQDLIIEQEQVSDYGHFLTFKTTDAMDIQKALRDKGIITDYRNDRLRFGFGLYHDQNDIEELFNRL